MRPVITKRPVQRAQGRPEQIKCVEGRVPQHQLFHIIVLWKLAQHFLNLNLENVGAVLSSTNYLRKESAAPTVP